ncbi:MAG: hypothetical protein AAF539_12535 [Planctomycetota bacterium]
MMTLTREGCRSAGATFGLALLLLATWSAGYAGLMPLAIAGALGAVLGGMTGERMYDGRANSR